LNQLHRNLISDLFKHLSEDTALKIQPNPIMTYLALIIAVFALASCGHLSKTAKQENQNNKSRQTETQLPFSGDIIKIKNRDVIKASSSNPNAFIMIGNCGISPYQAFNRDKSKVAI